MRSVGSSGLDVGVYILQRFKDFAGKQRLEIYRLSRTIAKGHVKKIVTDVVETVNIKIPSGKRVLMEVDLFEAALDDGGGYASRCGAA